MTDDPSPSRTPALDQWVAEVGEDGVVAAIEGLQSAISAESVPVLRDQASFHAYWGSRLHEA